MPDLISTATGPGIIDDAIRALDETAYVLEFLAKSDAYRKRFIPIWDEALSNFMVDPFVGGGALTHSRSGVQYPAYHAMAGLPIAGTGGRYRHQSILKDPETHQIVSAITSQGLTLLLGQRDYITATPIGRDDYEKARLLARMLMSAMSQSGVFKTHYQLIQDAYLFGTAYLEIGWETRSRYQMVPVGQDLVPREVLYRDAPLQRVVDIYDFYPDPTGTRIQEDMVGVAKRFRITAQEAMRMARAGIYDEEDVRLAIGSVLIANAKGTPPRTAQAPRRFQGDVQELPDRFMPLDGFEYWGESPVASPDKVQNRVITLLNGRRVRSRANPFIDGCIPFKEIVVNPLTGRHYGLGVAEVTRFLQDSTDALLMAFTDIVARAAKSPILVGQTWGGNPQDLETLPPVIACTDVKQVGNMPVEINVLQFCAAEIARRKLTMRDAVGGYPPQNLLQQDRLTATVGQEIVRLTEQHTEPMIMLIEREDYPWIGRTLHSRFRQFAPAGGVVATFAGESFEVPLEAIDLDADVRFVGARTGGSKTQKFQIYERMAQFLGSPVGRQTLLTSPEIIVRMYRDGADIPDAEDLVQLAQQRTLALMQVEMAQQAATGERGPGQPGQASPPANKPGQAGG